MLKKFLTLFMLSILSCTMMCCTTNASSVQEDIPTSIPDMSGYRNMDAQDHVYTEISFASLIELFRRKETAMVMISRENCIYCQNAVWVLNEAAKETGTAVYYVNADAPISAGGGKEENQRLYEELCGYMEDALRADETGEKGLYIPVVLNIQKGKLVKHHVSLTDSFNASQSEVLTEEEAKELTEIYKEVLK